MGSSSHILAAAGAADERTRVPKLGGTFAAFDHYGDTRPGGLGEEGLLLELECGRPAFLSSTVRDVNDQLAVALTNPARSVTAGCRLRWAPCTCC